jgi:hypothetical protein
MSNNPILMELNPAGAFGFMQSTNDPRSSSRTKKSANKQTSDGNVAKSGTTSSKKITLGSITPVIVNPTLRDTENDVSTNDSDVRHGKARESATVFESINRKRTHKKIAATTINRLRSNDFVNSGSDTRFSNTSNEESERTCSFPSCHRVATHGKRCELHSRHLNTEGKDPFAALLGGIVGYAIGRKSSASRKQQQLQPRTSLSDRLQAARPRMSDRMWSNVKAAPRPKSDHESGPWGPRVRDTANITGPRIKKPSGFPPAIDGVTPLSKRDVPRVRATLRKMKTARPFDDPLDDLWSANES